MKDRQPEVVTKHAKAYRDNRLTLGGLLAFCLLVTVQFLSQPALSTTAQFATACFAIAIPLLAVNVSLLTLELDYEQSCRPSYIWWSTWIGIAAGLIGVSAAFFVLHTWAGILFIVAAIAAAAVMFGFVDRIQKLNPDESEDGKIEQQLGQVSSETAVSDEPSS